MKTTALVAALLLATLSTAHAQGGPDGGGPAAGGPAAAPMEGPGGPGAGGPDAGMPGGGPEGGPAAKSPGEGLGDAPPAARDAAPAREAREKPAADTDRGRADSDRSRRAREAADDAGPKAEGKAKKAAERAKSDDEKSDAKSQTAQARGKEAEDTAKQAKESAKQAKDDVSQPEKGADTAGGEKPERAKQVDLSGEKRTRVETALRGNRDVKRRTDVHVDVSIGRRLPHDWHFVPVPIAVIEIVPEYRDYVYVWVEDEYVICDPVTYEVVAVLPAGGEDHASSGSVSGCSTRITLSDDQRELILRTVRLGHEVDVADLRVGWSVPGDIELERFPEPVLSEAGELRACRYFIADDQLAIVDPEGDKVVLLIDKG